MENRNMSAYSQEGIWIGGGVGWEVGWGWGGGLGGVGWGFQRTDIVVDVAAGWNILTSLSVVTCVKLTTPVVTVTFRVLC